MFELIQWITYDHVLTKDQQSPHFTTFNLSPHYPAPHSYSCRSTQHPTGPTNRRYQLLAVEHLNVAAPNPTSPTVPALRWVFKLAAQCHKPSATKESTTNKQHIQLFGTTHCSPSLDLPQKPQFVETQYCMCNNNNRSMNKAAAQAISVYGVLILLRWFIPPPPNSLKPDLETTVSQI
jgi:hypothetical protein